MRNSIVVMLATLPLGCGGTVGGTAGGTTGPAAGLQQRMLVTADGSHLPLGFFDPAHDTACTFLLAEDGQLRCLPVGQTTSIPYEDLLFADAACKQPLFVGPAGCPAIRFGWDSSGPAACALQPSYHIYQLTAISPATIYQFAGGSCQGGPAEPGKSYYRGEPIAPTDFVAGAIRPM